MGVTPAPYDAEAELALVGDMFGLPEHIPEIALHLTASDLWDRRAGAAVAVMLDDWRAGRRTDETSLLAGMRRHGYDDPGWLQRALSCGGAGWRTHLETIVGWRLGRDLLSAVHDIPKLVQTPGVDQWALLDELKGRLAALDAPISQPPGDFSTLDEFIDRPEHEASPWVVPGLLRRGWRVVVVGTEGGGKSMLFRQIAVLAAQGLHPLGFEPIPKVRALLIDLENPSDAISKSCRALRSRFDAETYEAGRAWIWHRPGGIDLRSRATRSELEAILAAARPDVVAVGPVYKAYRRRNNETDEEAVADVQAVLDDLRTRYSFALVLEHHAPQESGGYRKLRPYGSSLWLRWPEIGLAMQPDKRIEGRKSCTLERWRGDRMTNNWPDYLDEGDVWPWVGAWPNANRTLPL